MSLDIEKMAAPLTEDKPTGDNLEYDPLYMKLEELSIGVPAKQMGDSVVEGHEPEWGELQKACLSLFGKTLDLRVATYLTLAELCLHGLTGFRDGIVLTKTILCEYWETVWPQLDPDDDFDPLERINILSALSPTPGAYQDPMMFIQHLRSAPLTKSKQMGVFNLRDIMLANGELESNDPAPQLSLINAAFMDTASDLIDENYRALNETIEAIEAISDFLTETVGDNRSLSFESLLKDLNRMSQLYEQHISGNSSDAEEQVDEKEGSDDTNAVASDKVIETRSTAMMKPVSISTLEISSRSDAIKVLEKVCTYFEKAEPNSPIPFLIKRAVRISNMNYVDLIQELSPDSVDQIRTILGVSDSSESSSSDSGNEEE